MDYSIRLTEREEAIVREYAANKGISPGEAFKRALFEKIENDIDLKIAENAYAEYLKDPKSYLLDDVMEN